MSLDRNWLIFIIVNHYSDHRAVEVVGKDAHAFKGVLYGGQLPQVRHGLVGQQINDRHGDMSRPGSPASSSQSFSVDLSLLKLC